MKYLLAIVLIAISINSYSQDKEELRNTYSDKIEYEYRLKQIRESLNSFFQLTEKIKNEKNISNSILDGIDNTEWDIQAIGFQNWPDSLGIYRDIQHSELLSLKIELNQLKKGSKSELQSLITEKEILDKKIDLFLEAKLKSVE